MCARACVCSPVVPHLCFIHFPFVHSVFFLLDPSAFVLCLFHIRFPLVLHLFFDLFFICFQFVLRLFSTLLMFVFHLSSFILRSFFISPSFVSSFAFFFIYLPFIFHLFSISVPFYFPVLGESRHSFTKPNMVRARSRLNTVLSRDQFSARISAKPTNGCQGETQSFPGKTLHVRLGSEIRELQLSK